jgi:hypothetical protein
VVKDTYCIITTQAKTKVISTEPRNKAATDATKAKEEKKAYDINAGESGEWNWNEAMHDY